MLAAQDFPPEHQCRKLCSGFRKNEARLPKPPAGALRAPAELPLLSERPMPEFALAYADLQARYVRRRGVSACSRAMCGSCKA